MAQSFEEILNDINVEQAQHPELNVLNSSSATSFWKLVKDMFALLVLAVQKSFDMHKKEIDLLIISQQIGTLPWYVDMLKKFQYGDTIYVEDNLVKYAVVDENKKIISSASAAEIKTAGKSEVLFKAVKSDNNGNRVSLSINEYDALEEYISKIKFAGVTTILRSEAADIIKLNMTVELNLLAINADGTSIENNSEKPIEMAIKEYFKNLPFDGVLYWNKLIDELQKMPEVKDAVISESWSYLNGVYTPFTRLYNSYSGHLILDVNSAINYV